jgi:hypothetical protein
MNFCSKLHTHCLAYHLNTIVILELFKPTEKMMKAGQMFIFSFLFAGHICVEVGFCG